ncbi:membrane fusion protein (multidrug efflux system) [Cricetibacter osteomyelitidis]|uniref:Membrane fusion protein (Multidrug efflux system) n=1 Tax=Cricetibacter osteomyelitidis TaxID=1521931 RepID=A0A4R2SYC6_9PAST|nr:efflux RND transporter periplasmic adaptor subunit [Cricetibacter osteomyelitidis]TCP94680.1 membrane fusion protein (multidrug efflux system) [Cricetibacter osteomyelitidis]
MEQTQNKPKKSHSFLLRLVLVIVLAIFVAMIILNIIKSKAIANAIANAGETPSPVTAMIVESKQWTPVIETTGLVRPNQGSMLSIQTGGVVKRVLIKDGQAVKKGDVLVELDSSVEQATLKASEAQLPALRATYNRYANLIKSNSVSQTELDSAKASYDAMVAQIASLKASIERMKVIAPFDGITGIVQVNVGEYVAASSDIVRVEDRSMMKIDFAISQNRIDELYVGQKVTATADARLGQTFSAKITAIEPAITKSSGLVNVQAVFDGENAQELMSGMFARLRVALPTENNQIVVPQVAISYNMYGEIAYVLKPLAADDAANKEGAKDLYRAQQITVTTKDRQGIYAQLKPGDVKIGDLIVTNGQQNLNNGKLVQVQDQQAVGTVAPAKETSL